MATEVMLLGLCGGAMSGKTTVAKHLLEKEEGWTIYSFAAPLKEMLIKAGICKAAELYYKKTPFSREMMQKIGTNLIRCQIDPQFWNNIAEKQIFNRLVGGSRVVIDDVRFPDEAALIRKHGGKIIKLRRMDFDSNRPDINPGHFSENALHSIVPDVEILAADGDVRRLVEEVENALKVLKP